MLRLKTKDVTTAAIACLFSILLSACTDYQAEFEDSFGALEYASDMGESSSSGNDDLSSSSVPASSDAEPISSGATPAEPSSSSADSLSSGAAPTSSSGEPSSSAAESSSSEESSSSADADCYGMLYHSQSQFCDSTSHAIYNKCGGRQYDPTKYYCSQNPDYSNPIQELWTCKLGDESSVLYNPETQYCDKSSGAEEKDLCGDKYINPNKEYCYKNGNSEVKVDTLRLCGTDLYNPLTQFCQGTAIGNRLICSKDGNADPLDIDIRYNSAETDGHYGEFCDGRDYQVYKYQKIGSQVWMTKNLNYAYLKPARQYEDSSSYCYKGEPENCAKYGRLYTWYAAMDSANVTNRNICPEGWHLPDQAEWWQLIGFVEEDGGEYAGILLKSTTDDWGYVGAGPRGKGTDRYGFTGLPAGSMSKKGTWETMGISAYFWSSTQAAGFIDEAFRVVLNHNGDAADTGSSDKKNAFSIRCVKND